MIVPPIVSIGLFVLLVLLTTICSAIDVRVKNPELRDYQVTRLMWLQRILISFGVIGFAVLLIVTFWNPPNIFG